jgi:hypothetical protein
MRHKPQARIDTVNYGAWPTDCRANTIHVQVDDEGNAQVWAEPEQDYE